jgi:hypothetical protein
MVRSPQLNLMLEFPRFAAHLCLVQRNPFEATEPFEDRLSKQAAERRARAQSLPPGIEREELLRLARQCEIAANIAAGSHRPA